MVNKKEINEKDIQLLSEILFGNIKYRNTDVMIHSQSGEKYFPPKPSEVSKKIDELIEWCYKNFSNPDLHPLVKATYFHYKFISIHPFLDFENLLVPNGFMPFWEINQFPNLVFHH